MTPRALLLASLLCAVTAGSAEAQALEVPTLDVVAEARALRMEAALARATYRLTRRFCWPRSARS